MIPAVYRTGCIADVGCGQHPHFLLNTRFSCKIGLDKVINQSLADHPAAQGITFIAHDVEQDPNLPAEHECCDVVTMLAVIEHLEPRIVVPSLAEINRILKPGGRFILTVPAGCTDFLLRIMARLKLVSGVEIQEHKTTYTRKKISNILKTVFSEDRLMSSK